jgi:hypothetical protein
MDVDTAKNIINNIDRSSTSSFVYDGKKYKITKVLRICVSSNPQCYGCGINYEHFDEELRGDFIYLRPYGYKDGVRTYFTCDHIIPKSKRGSNSADNLAIMCEECNIKKDNFFDMRECDVLYSVVSVKTYVNNVFPNSKNRVKCSKYIGRFVKLGKHMDNNQVLKLLREIKEKFGFDVSIDEIKLVPKKKRKILSKIVNRLEV